MKNADLIRIIDDLARQIANGAKPFTPDMPGHVPMQITFPPKLKYKFSRAHWYEADYDWILYGEVSDWCKEQFGPHDVNPDAWSRWNHKYEGKIYFRDQKDYQWFVLRWGA